MKDPLTLKAEARLEGYNYFHTNIRNLPRNADGSFNESDPMFVNTDLDAFRHAYVSGVFTMEYGSAVADLFGRLNELTSGSSPGASPGEQNMDLWNNSIGRKHGQKQKTREALQRVLREALQQGELIISPDDKRLYEGASHMQLNPLKSVVVLGENQTGKNETFYDFKDRKLLDRNEFVTLIKEGKYPGYLIRRIDGIDTPTSKSDGTNVNNLG